VYQGNQTVLEENVVIKQLEKICLQPEFKNKRLLCKFLSYIVSEKLAGREAQIKGYTIAVEAFNKNADFNSHHKSNLLRLFHILMRKGKQLYYKL
jgi:hypothetical protein